MSIVFDNIPLKFFGCINSFLEKAGTYITNSKWVKKWEDIGSNPDSPFLTSMCCWLCLQ